MADASDAADASNAVHADVNADAAAGAACAEERARAATSPPEPATAPAVPPASPPVIIEARPGWKAIDLREAWHYRHLLWILALRNLQVRYKQTIMGATWAVVQPLVTMLVFTTLFYLLGREPVGDETTAPYAVTLYCALLPWQMFASALRGASDSLVQNQRLITKVYFPRVLVAFAPAMTALIDFAIAFVILLAMMAWFGIAPTPAILALPLLLILAMVTAWAAGLWLAAINALYRDVHHAVPFGLQILMLLSPVVYETAGLIPEQWQSLYSLNPLVTVIEGFRWALLGNPAPALGPALASMAIVSVIFVTGLFYFRRIESTIADRV